MNESGNLESWDIVYNEGGWRKTVQRESFQALTAGLHFPVDFAVSVINGVGFFSELQKDKEKKKWVPEAS